MARKHHKYAAQPQVTCDGKFASKKELKRWNELKVLESAGELINLEHDPALCTFELYGQDGSTVCKYIADYVYMERGKQIAEDCKGFKTPLYRLKRKLFQAQYKDWIHRES
jgi:Protein of unknown function (DUF1064)